MDPIGFALPPPQIPSDFYLPLHRPRKKQRPRIIQIEGAIASSRNPKLQTKEYAPRQQCPTPPCTECGKKFFSWKALFGHMRCHPERQWRGIRRPSTVDPNSALHSPTLFTADEIEVASCLLMLANGTGHTVEHEEEEVAEVHVVRDAEEPSGLNSRFECSSCKKVFGSHQALGGHRASHKNVKGCSAITRTDDILAVGDYTVGDGAQLIPTLGHQCNTCLKIFSSGQALGGHKRCHWEKNEEQLCSLEVGCASTAVAKYCTNLDLNLPAPMGEEEFPFRYKMDLDLRLGI